MKLLSVALCILCILDLKGTSIKVLFKSSHLYVGASRTNKKINNYLEMSVWKEWVCKPRAVWKEWVCKPRVMRYVLQLYKPETLFLLTENLYLERRDIQRGTSGTSVHSTSDIDMKTWNSLYETFFSSAQKSRYRKQVKVSCPLYLFWKKKARRNFGRVNFNYFYLINRRGFPGQMRWL